MVERAKIDVFETVLTPDPSRTVVRPFEPGYPTSFDHGPTRTAETIDLILALDDAELARQLKGVTASLDENHRDVDALLMRRFGELAPSIAAGAVMSRSQKLLIGAYFCQEYAYEAVALFNPSAVLHPDQSGLAHGTVRFILSLRGIGEGHVSSVTFRTGTWAPGAALAIDDPGTVSVPPHIRPDSDEATSFQLDCGGSRNVAETVLFPLTPSQRQGIEDLRLVRFVDDDGTATYHGTYTAFSGAAATSELLSTSDFVSFRMRPLTGNVAGAKGMALFPRRIDG